MSNRHQRRRRTPAHRPVPEPLVHGFAHEMARRGLADGLDQVLSRDEEARRRRAVSEAFRLGKLQIFGEQSDDDQPVLALLFSNTLPTQEAAETLRKWADVIEQIDSIGTAALAHWLHEPEQ